jgi:hypothetical protein
VEAWPEAEALARLPLDASDVTDSD